MDSEGFEGKWAALSEEVLSGMRDWRAQHPRATLREIEAEVDSRLAGLRARLVEDVALRSRAVAWSGRAGTAARCPDCGNALQPRGKQTRRLKTQGGQELTLRRDYGVCPHCGQTLFPPR
jgi:predicted RNA-binding Zn-ribbon protein involved in translation (DUF1610 family)